MNSQIQNNYGGGYPVQNYPAYQEPINQSDIASDSVIKQGD